MTYTPPATWPTEPEPHPYCTRCRELDEQRTTARRSRDMAAVTDCNVLLRRHIKLDHPAGRATRSTYCPRGERRLP